MSLFVDVIIPVHDVTRPVGRAVRSVLAGGLSAERLRVTVVCHNLPSGQVARVLGTDLASRVRLLELRDGVHSPSGPFNCGLDAAEASFVSIMGSDDYVEEGALRAWASMARRAGLDVVLPVQRRQSGGLIPTPPVRLTSLRRGVAMDPLADRLVYRTAPIGLMRLSLVRRLGLAFTPGLPTGEDQEFSARLWFSPARVGYAVRRPAYVVGEDAGARTTLNRRPAREELAACEGLVRSDWFAAQSLEIRRAIAVKLVRVHIFSFVSRRCEADDWTAEEHDGVGEICRIFSREAPGFSDHLSLADARVVKALSGPPASGTGVADLMRARRRFYAPAAIRPVRLKNFLAPDAPARFIVASVATRFRR